MLLQEVEEAPKAMGPAALLRTIGKKTRHRSGYDDDASLLGKQTTAVEFVMAKDPMPLLATCTSMIVDSVHRGVHNGEGGTEGGSELAQERSIAIAAHPATTEEVHRLIVCCSLLLWAHILSHSAHVGLGGDNFCCKLFLLTHTRACQA